MVAAGAVWSEQDTTPGAIEAALRELLKEDRRQAEGHAPARVLNLVVIVDREWRGEILNRLERVGRYHPSRTILCTVEAGRTTIDASALITVEPEARASRGHIRSASVAPRARTDRLGEGQPPAGLLHRRRAVLRLALLTAGL